MLALMRTARRSLPLHARLLALATALLAAALPGAGRATEPHALRDAALVPGWVTQEGGHMAALHLALAPGWKTYWRAPGETGIPPQIAFSRSENLAEARLHWPAPEVIESVGQRSLGYSGALTLPIELTPARPGAPIALRADLEIGVCRDICVPVSLRLSADLPTAPGSARGAHAGRLAAALANRPRMAAEAGIGAVSCALDPISDGARLDVRIANPPQGTKAAAVELPDPLIWISDVTLGWEGAALSASADLVPPPGQPLAFDRGALTITLIGPMGAVEISGCAGAR